MINNFISENLKTGDTGFSPYPHKKLQEKFEEQFSTKESHVKIMERDDSGGYLNAQTHCQWMGFKAGYWFGLEDAELVAAEFNKIRGEPAPS